MWIVFTGAKEGFMLGMKARLREHADDLHKDRTWFVNVDTVGNGDLHHVTAEDSGCSSGTTVASSPPASGWARRPTCGGSARDGVVPLMRGYPSITLCALENGRIPNFHRPSDTVENIDPGRSRRFDSVEELVRRIEAFYQEASADRMPSSA